MNADALAPMTPRNVTSNQCLNFTFLNTTSPSKTVRLGAIGVRYRTLFKKLKIYLFDNQLFTNWVSILA